jgi:hypothetical protein
MVSVRHIWLMPFLLHFHFSSFFVAVQDATTSCCVRDSMRRRIVLEKWFAVVQALLACAFSGARLSFLSLNWVMMSLQGFGQHSNDWVDSIDDWTIDSAHFVVRCRVNPASPLNKLLSKNAEVFTTTN